MKDAGDELFPGVELSRDVWDRADGVTSAEFDQRVLAQTRRVVVRRRWMWRSARVAVALVLFAAGVWTGAQSGRNEPARAPAVDPFRGNEDASSPAQWAGRSWSGDEPMDEAVRRYESLLDEEEATTVRVGGTPEPWLLTALRLDREAARGLLESSSSSEAHGDGR